MPSQGQPRGKETDYPSDAHRMIATKPESLILSIKPMTEENARTWLGAANTSEHGTDEMVQHFVSEVQRLSD